MGDIKSRLARLELRRARRNGQHAPAFDVYWPHQLIDNHDGSFTTPTGERITDVIVLRWPPVPNLVGDDDDDD